jgi:hypothetical protein
MRKILTVFAMIGALSLGMSAARAQNLLANPGFELPTSTTTSTGNWMRFDAGAAFGSSVDSTVMPHSGTGHVDLKTLQANSFAGVFQLLPVPVNPGDTVTFTGWHKSVGTSNQTSEIKLEWQGTPNPPQNRMDVLNVGNDYTMFTHSGVAPAGTAGVVITYAISSFGAGQGASQVYIDDFSATVTPVPEPAAAGLLGLGLAVIAARRRRKA